MYIYVYIYIHTHTHLPGATRYEQALVCLSNREIVDASRGCTFHCKTANHRFCSLIVSAEFM